MRNGKEGVSYRLIFLNGSTAVKTVNFVDGVASDSTAFSTEGNYTIALVAGTVVLQQYANIRVGNPPAQTYTLTGTIQNNPGSSAIIFTVDGNVVASGSQVAEGKTVHVEITNADQDWEAFTVNNMTKVTTLSGTSRVVDFTMPSSNASCVASFTAPTPSGNISNATIDGAAWDSNKTVTEGNHTIALDWSGASDKRALIVSNPTAPTVGGQEYSSGHNFTNGHASWTETLGVPTIGDNNPRWLIVGAETVDPDSGNYILIEEVWPFNIQVTN